MSNRYTRVLIILTTAALIGGCTDGNAAAEGGDAALQPTAVAVETLGERVLERPIVAIGTVIARDDAALAFKVGGVVREVLVRRGERVEAGQTLARLDTTEIDARVRQARLGLEKAERDVERIADLVKRQLVQGVQLDDARTLRDLAIAALKAAEFDRRYAVIEAPTAGLILDRSVNPDDLVGAGQTAFSFGSDVAGRALKVALADRDAVRVAIGHKAQVRFDAYGDQLFDAEVSEVPASATATLGLFEFELRFVDPAFNPLPGLVARVEFPVAGMPVLAVPLAALLETANGQSTVYRLVDERRVERVAVRVLPAPAPYLAVVEGLKAGDRVVTAGADYLADGSLIAARESDR